MIRIAFVRTAFLVILVTTPAAAQQAQEPIRLVVGYPAGSNTDLVARVLADALGTRLARPVEVENRTGRGGVTAAAAVARAAPDGATLELVPPSFTTVRHVTSDLGFDPRTDVTPISLFGAAALLVLVPQNSPARDLHGLAATLKAGPSICGSPGAGTLPHLAGVLLTQSLGARCDALHHTDPAAGIADLQAGKTQLYINAATTSLRAVNEGKVRALAVASRQRLAAAPELPTVAETVPGFEAETWYALLGPPGLPQALVARLEQATMEAARDPSVVARLRALGAEPVGSTAAELAARLRAEDARWGEAAKAAGLASK